MEQYSSSRELVPLADAHAEMLQRAANSLDMTAIYNRHSFPTDAEKSVELVEPNSIVFIEGYILEPTNNVNNQSLQALNHLHLTLGTDSEAYQLYKEALIDTCESEVTKPAGSVADFNAHYAKEISLLAQKDCLIYTADLINTPGFSKYVNLDDEFFKNNTSRPQPISVGAQLRNTRRRLVNDYENHTIRELMATRLVMANTAGILVQHPAAATTLRHAPSGKLQSYIIYGTAHAASMTEKLTSAGIDTDIEIIDPVEQHLYLDRTIEEFDKNLHRRIGHKTLTNLSYLHLQPETAQEVEKLTYSKLEHLNTDKEAALKFAVHTLQVIQRSYEDYDKGYEEYDGILRDLLPEHVE